MPPRSVLPGFVVTILASVVVAVPLGGAPQEKVELPILKSPYELTCQPARENACGVDWGVVSSAVQSPEALWTFLTSPDAGFTERQAAAVDSATIAPLDWLVRIDAAHRELNEAGFAWAWWADNAAMLPRPRDGRESRVLQTDRSGDDRSAGD